MFANSDRLGLGVAGLQDGRIRVERGGEQELGKIGGTRVCSAHDDPRRMQIVVQRPPFARRNSGEKTIASLPCWARIRSVNPTGTVDFDDHRIGRHRQRIGNHHSTLPVLKWWCRGRSRSASPPRQNRRLIRDKLVGCRDQISGRVAR